MKRLLPVVAAVLVLAGCSGAGTVAESATPTASPPSSNEAACEAFGEATVTVGNAVANSEGLELDIPGAFDEVRAEATGDVKIQLGKLIDNLPEPAHMIGFLENRDAYNRDVEAVVRACESAGYANEYATLVAG